MVSNYSGRYKRNSEEYQARGRGRGRGGRGSSGASPRKRSKAGEEHGETDTFNEVSDAECAVRDVLAVVEEGIATGEDIASDTQGEEDETEKVEKVYSSSFLPSFLPSSPNSPRPDYPSCSWRGMAETTMIAGTGIACSESRSSGCGLL
jgi:hypothetical protein